MRKFILKRGFLKKMEYKQLINKYFPVIFREIKQSTLNEPEIYNFVENEEVLLKFLEKQEELLTVFFKSFPEAPKENIEEISQFYIKEKVPYALTLKNLKILKSRLIEELSSREEDFSLDFVFQIKQYFKVLENIIAKSYLISDIKQLKDLKSTVFSKYLLYNAYLEFIEKMIYAVENNDMDNFPLIPVSESNFHKYITYPESLMICINASLCNHIEDIYSTIHRLAITFYSLYVKGNFSDAYLVFKELKDNSLKLSKILAELYFITFSNVEDHFFKLVEELEEWNKRRFVFIIDVQNLKTLNKIYSEKNINLVLKEVEEKIRSITNRRRDKLLFIKGLTANFYLLALDISDKQVKELANEIKNVADGIYKIDDYSIKINLTVGALEIEQYSDNSKNEIIKILLYIKEKAKKTGTYFVINKHEKQELKNWLNQKYRNASFVESKISQKEIDTFFQPIIDLQTGEIKHLEVLARIRDGETVVPTDVFIDVVNELHLEKELDMIILEKIYEKRKTIKSIANSIFININPKSFSNDTFVKKLRWFLREMEDFSVTFEITEKDLLEDLIVLKRLKNEFPDIKFAIDDFGTGYSSFRLVADLAENKTLHVLKIDKSLIRDIPQKIFTQRVIKAISLLSKSLGIETIAEFVENEQILNVLKEIHVDYAQGYFISKPKDIEELLLRFYT